MSGYLSASTVVKQCAKVHKKFTIVKSLKIGILAWVNKFRGWFIVCLD